MVNRVADDKKEDKKQIYFLDCGVHSEHLKASSEDAAMIRSHLHHYTSDKEKPDSELLIDLCEYYCLLEGFVKLLQDIQSFPVVPSADDPDKEEYVIGSEQALLLKFYLPMLVQLENKVRRRNLSLAIH
tara:strand:- start:620 stop:1006 length:387 start_codon:yes stop_codon:yes gene_type:complete